MDKIIHTQIEINDISETPTWPKYNLSLTKVRFIEENSI